MRVTATGKTVSMSMPDRCRFADGQIARVFS